MRLFGYKLSIVAQIGLAIIALNLIVALFAPLDRALRSGDARRRPLGGPGRQALGSASTISAATCSAA